MTYLIVLFAISIAFWRLGSPVGSSLCRSEIALRCLEGFLEFENRHVNLQPFQTKRTTENIHKPDISPNLSPTPARMPTIPIWPRGFWSNHSFTNSRVYSRLRSNRVGRMSRSIIEFERSRTMMRWRMIVRRIAFEGASNLIMRRVSGVITYGGGDGYCTFCDVHGL
jgi:hypothetical protein